MKIKLYSTLSLLFISFWVFSQGEKVIHPTPEAATLIKMAQNEVNLNTGTANIGIPLYTLSEGGITVPIGLNYAGAGGIKVEEAATWVGLGWNLNAGGQITRVVRDKPDESYTMNFKKNEKNLYLDRVTLGFNLKAASIDVTWQNETLRYRGGWFLTGSVMNSESRLYDDFKKSDPMLFDTAPDIYIADLGGEIVKFTFDEESKPVVLNNKDVKIQVVWEDYDPSEYFTKQEWSLSATISGDEMWGNKMNSIFGSGVALGLTLGLDQFFRIPRDNPAIIGFRKWIITTADGVEWHFGEEDKNNAETNYLDYNFNYQNLFTRVDRLSIALTNLHSKIPSAWHLQKIVSPYGLKDIVNNQNSVQTQITFEYEKTGMYMPYHSTDILVKPANPCDFPKSKQPLFFIPVDVSAGVKIPINTNSAYEGDLNVGLNASFYYDPTKNDAFVELNTMVVYGKQIKKIISPNFEITFNSDALFKKDYATNNFKKIIPGYNIGQFSDVARKDIQGEHVLSTAEMKRNSTVSLTEEGLSYNYDNWGVKIGSVPMIYYDNGSFSANLSGTGLFLSWKGKIYREDLTKPFMHEHNRLKNIQIYDKSSQLSKAYYFDYDYFTPREVSSLATLDEKSDLPATFYKQLHNKYINVAGADKYRLKLKGVYEMVLNSQNEPTSLIPGYTFDYNLTPLPRRLSMAQDHWGYYNGEHANRNKTQFIARMTYNTYDLSGNVVQQGGQYPCPNSSNRDANLEFCKAGILEKITYPTGGSKTFNYELHAAHNFPKPVGGLRIESIQTYDPVLAKTYIESYTYKHEYIADRSSGFLSVYPDYYFTHKNEDLPRIVHADYMNHLLSDFVNDGYISYARVMVKQTGTGTGNGYSVHEFNNFERPATDRKNIISDAPITPSNFSFDSYNSSVEHSDENLTGNITGQYDENYYANLTKRPEYDYTKGSLKRTAIFTEANKLVKEILYEYTQPENIPVKTIKAADVIKRLPFEKLSAGVQIGIWVIPVPPFVMPGIGLDMTLQAERTGEAYPYEINVGKFHLLKQIERNYNLNDGGYLTSEVNFEYSPKHHELVKQTTKNSNGDVVENIRKFSFDLVPEETAVIIPLPNVTPLVSEYLPRLSKEERYINLLLEDVTKRNGKVIGGKVNIYHDDANAGIGVVKQIAGLIKEEYVLETNVPLNDFNEIKNLVKVTINPSNLTSTRESFLTIDPRYTLRSQYTEYNNRGLLVKSNKVGFPSSKITYGYNDLIPIQVTQETNKGNRSVNYELIPLYGVTRTINPDGTELRYRYDSVGRLLEIRDINNKLVKSYQYNYRAQ